MRRAIACVFLALAPLWAAAQGADATQVPPAPAGTPADPLPAETAALEDFLWTNQVIVVFADGPADPAFVEQMRLLQALPEELAERDVVVITDTDPAQRSAVRLSLRPRGFMLVLIGKDGQVALRRPSPRDVRELSRAIDKMPIRQEELRARRLGR